MSSPPVNRAAPFGIYLHWPFCKAICPYCDFNRELAGQIDSAAWGDAYALEIARQGARTKGLRPSSLFFGGGTPSLMPADLVARVIAAVRATWDCPADMEITLEANPTSSEAKAFEALAAAGVNRLSLGIQALNDPDLLALGRKHSAAEGRRAIALAKQVFPRWSFDLIYARPGQTAAAWEKELAAALELGSRHLSLYQLTIEEGTPFYGLWKSGALKLPEDSVAEGLFEATQARLEKAGLPAYEVSNHAAPGQEARHNLTYWRSGDYLGIGPGAHGRLTLGGVRTASRQHRAASHWLAETLKDGAAPESLTPLTRAEIRDEIFLMGLRTYEGVQGATTERLLGLKLADCLDAAAVQRFLEARWLLADDACVRMTKQGMQRLNALLPRLLDKALPESA